MNAPAPLKGLRAGIGLAFDDNLTLAIATGAANITTVDGAREQMTVTSEGHPLSFPVSRSERLTIRRSPA